MSTNNLDRSLQDIISTKPRRGGVAKRRVSDARGSLRAPLTRSSPMVKGGRLANPPGANYDGTSKVIVSNLPLDVNEQQIKEYFSRTIAPLKSVNVSYDRTGRSSGVATVVFRTKDGAEKALKEYNGRPVDNRKTMKVEIVAPESNPLDNRIGGGGKSVSSGMRGRPRGRTVSGAGRGGPRSGVARSTRSSTRTTRAARPKKTTEELDQEMTDYFDAK